MDISSKPPSDADSTHGSTTSSAQSTQVHALGLWLKLLGLAGGWPVGHAWLIDTNGTLRDSGQWYAAEDAPMLADLMVATAQLGTPTATSLPGQVLQQESSLLADDLGTLDNFERQAVMHAAGLHAAYLFPLGKAPRIRAILEFFSPLAKTPSGPLQACIAQLDAELDQASTIDDRLDDVPRNLDDRRQILDGAGEAFVGMDEHDRITDWNLKAGEIFGWTREEAMGRSVTDTIIPESYREDHRKGVAHFIRTEVPKVLGKRLEMEGLHKDGRIFPIEITQWSLKAREGWRFYAFIADITERKQASRRLEWLAYYDPLTGLPNRTLLLERLAERLEARDRKDRTGSLYFIGLDHFKWINESFGYDTGNQVLKAMAQRLCAMLAPEDIVARNGGDEFVVIAETGSPGQAQTLGERLLAAIAHPLELHSDRLFLSASLGHASLDADNHGEALLRAADIALARAKKMGRSQCVAFEPQMQSQARDRLLMEKELADAIEQQQLRLYFQPIVDAHSEQLVALESLVRWQHPQRGLVSPLDFIPLAEETGLIVPIGAWVLAEAHRWAARWEQAGQLDRSLYIAVNLSARQLAQSDLIDTVRKAMQHDQVRLQHASIGMEVTESVVMRNPEDAARTLSALRELGMHLSIDDFGTGYSSLAYLKQFPVNVLKVDISFVRHVVEDPKDRAIVRSIAQLAKALGLSVVAEGVETRAQRDVLRTMDIDLLQGYLYAKPMPGKELARLLEQADALQRG